MAQERKKIERDFIKWLKDDLQVYQHYDTTKVDLETGKDAYELDKEEQYVHVEFCEDCCIIWDIKRWKDSEELNARRKVASDRARQQYYLDDENILIVSKALAKTTHIKDFMLLKPLAVEIIKKGKFDALPFLDLRDLKVRIE